MSEIYQDKFYTAICSEKTLQSNEKGFFMLFVRNVMQSVGSKWIETVFGSLKTDKNRIRIIYEFEPVRSIVFSTLAHVQEIYRKKNAEFSQSRRIAAEESFSKGENQKALALCTQSILRSPPIGEDPAVDSGLSLGLGLWSRSEILLALKNYNLALIDVQMALKERLPDFHKAKAYWRMGICFKAMGIENKAKVSFGIAEKLLQNNENELAALRRDMQKVYEHAERECGSVLPRITGGSHPKYVHASGKLCVKEAKHLGTFVAAQDRIKTGDTLVVEEPYAACLLPDCFGTHCHHCFERLIAPVGCCKCCSIAFCKADCRDKALNTYHQYECKYLDLLIGSGMSILAHTSLRMITQNTLERTLEIYGDRSGENVYSLCTNANYRKADDFFQRTLMACFLLRCLQKSGYFPNRNNEECMPTEDELKVGELLLFNLQMLQFNAHEVCETRRSASHRYKGAKTASIGVAVYPTVALFNHSCYPGVTRHFIGKDIVINAVKSIAPGEMVAENYGPIFTRRTLMERQKSLSARYWFKCQCIACVQDWPSYSTGLENVTKKVKCPTTQCTFLFTLPVSDECLKCPCCTKKVSLTDNIWKFNNCEEQLRKASDMLDKQERPEECIQLLVRAIETFHEISVPPHRDIHLGQELLRTLFAETGNVFLSI